MHVELLVLANAVGVLAMGVLADFDHLLLEKVEDNASQLLDDKVEQRLRKWAIRIDVGNNDRLDSFAPTMRYVRHHLGE